MKLRNQIVNYFVAYPNIPGGMPRVFQSPVTMKDDVGKAIIEQQLKKNNDSISAQRLLHVCFDLDSEKIYIPNASDFPKDQMEILLKAAQIKITKEFGGFSNSPPIEGSPFSSVRVRSISSFGNTLKSIEEHFKGKKFVDLPVIEANLARMPTTVKSLPKIYSTNKKYVGSYIGPSFANSITFYDEKELSGKVRKQAINLLTQKTPFILIDITPSVEADTADKEWTVLSGYRDFIYDKSIPENANATIDQNEADHFNSFADLYAIKRHLYLGWPFEEVCSTVLEEVSSFGELINGITALMETANSLEKEGYKNPAQPPYYITFKIDVDKFPIRLETMMSNEKQFDPFRQIENFRIIDYDTATKYILIETPAYISPNLCLRILKAQNRPLIARYNFAVNTIDVKSPSGTFREYQTERKQMGKISALVNYDIKKGLPEKEQDEIQIPQFKDDERSRSISLANPDVCIIRKLSDYLYATDHIKKICEKRGMEFQDLKIVIGPIERIFGRGVQGGFMGAKQWSQNKLKIPHELEKGLFVSPPLISINSVTMPSYASQTTTLVHEYCHNLYSISNPDHEHLYNKDKNLKSDNLKWWQLYFEDEDEIQAHIEQIKLELISGRSVDEIVRDKVGGAIDLQNYKRDYPIAIKFRELVEEAAIQLQEEEIKNEKPTGSNTGFGNTNQTTKKT